MSQSEPQDVDERIELEPMFSAVLIAIVVVGMLTIALLFGTISTELICMRSPLTPAQLESLNTPIGAQKRHVFQQLLEQSTQSTSYHK